MLTISTGASASLGVSGWAPSWSPTSNSIAYISGGLYGPLAIINSDGTGNRALSTGVYLNGIDWSPDGKYLIARSSATGYLDVFDVASGTSLQLPYSGSLAGPTWLQTVATGVASRVATPAPQSRSRSR